MPIRTPKIWLGVAEERERQAADSERRAAVRIALVGSVVDRRVVGVRREVVEQARLRTGVGRDAVLDPPGLAVRLRDRRVAAGALAGDREAAAAGAAAERDQQVAVGRQRVDEADELQDRSQQREVVAADGLEHVEHRHRPFADQLREVGDDRDLALEQLDHRHQRPGDLLDLLDDRGEEVADELAGVEVDRVEVDVEVGEVEPVRRVDGEAPVEVELPEHAREAGALADVEPRPEADVDVRLAGERRREADVAGEQVGDGDPVVARRQVELDARGRGRSGPPRLPRDRRSQSSPASLSRIVTARKASSPARQRSAEKPLSWLGSPGDE